MPGFVCRSAVIVGALVLAVAGCASSGSYAKPAGAPSGTSSPAVAGSQIVISNFAFSPMNLTVSAGEKVTVVNHDSTAHTLTAVAGNAFNTGTIGPGQSGTFTAPTKPGSYPYICGIHQFMHGTVTVR